VTTKIYFSPHGGCAKAIIDKIEHAKKQILFQAYSFTSTGIIGALLSAKAAGIDVRGILDKSWPVEAPKAKDAFLNGGIPILIDSVHNIAHNKILIIDNQVVITGSYNFTESAERSNAENVLIINNKMIAAEYIINWHNHESHSTPAPSGPRSLALTQMEFPRE
jgi:phosphatidylserine/phosphatidylglycerophosphate/cardiolipin synthase-like enzyme